MAITILTTFRHQYTVTNLQAKLPAAVRTPLVTATYEALPAPEETGDVVVFADLERLGAGRRAALARYHDALVRLGRTVLNHPTNSLVRLPLLQRLHAERLNAHTAHRLDSSRSSWRFPVFLRLTDDHGGAETPRLHSQAEVDRAAAILLRTGIDPRRLIAVEFAETQSRDGLYRTYGVYRIGHTYFLAHIVFAPVWDGKTDATLDDALLREECAAIRAFRPPPAIVAAFECANIEYGRMDCAMVGGRICIWEINTNPSLVDQDPAEILTTEAGGLYLRNMRTALGRLAMPDHAMAAG